ncbi:hypothetical protein EST38_g6299 [Candolleomyces aberdarensis]|uniref:Small ribosomal subunit protein uS7 domain-containing protein n=1 Tax=Candolleomyces aberdarensis TaxID=2316362 RepID=A0A4Q2DI68_9AGAR|nr:hypothetical protein EST38_g6299 [Candolleomyces aberdarensis]
MLSLWRRPTLARTLLQYSSRPLSTTPRRNNQLEEARDVLGEPSVPVPTPTTPSKVLTESSSPLAQGEDALFEVPPERDPLLQFLTTSVMKHGRYARAKKVISEMLLHIHTLTRAPPMPIVREAILKASPAVRVASTKVGARAIVRPIALSERQRTGKGIKWIIEASHDKPGKQMQVRLAKEMVAVVRGQSSALKKKEEAHKSAMVARGAIRTR